MKFTAIVVTDVSMYKPLIKFNRIECQFLSYAWIFCAHTAICPEKIWFADA